MSYKKINIFDDRLVMKEPFIPSYKGASNISKVIAKPTNFVQNQAPTQITYNITTIPSNNVPRYPVFHNVWSYNLAITNRTGAAIAAGTVILAQGVDVTMSQYPFVSNIVGNAEVSINGTSMGSVPVNRIAKKLVSIGEVKENVKYATCPSAPELYASCTDAALTMGNSQATFNDSTWDSVPNGSYTLSYNIAGLANPAAINANGDVVAPVGGIANNGVVNVTVVCETWEPLLGITPFIWDSKKDDAYALFAMNNIIINFNLLNSDAKASRALRCLATSVLNTANNGVTFAVAGFNMTNSELHYFLMRPPASLSYKVPRESVLHTYQYYYNSYSKGAGSFGNPAVMTTIEMDNYVSSGMPTYMLIWADPNADKALNLNDFNYPIQRLTMEMNGIQNILNLYNQADLFNMSKDAGLQSTYLNFIGKAYGVSFAADGTPAYAQSIKKLCSAPIVVRPGISFPLPEDISTNSSGSFTFKFIADVLPTNVAGLADNVSNPRLNVLCVYDAYLSIDTSTLACRIDKCPLLPRDVLDAPASASITEEQLPTDKPLSENALPAVGAALSAGRFERKYGIMNRLKK